MCKIVSLQAENIKRLSAVSIKPDGSMVVIGGQNDQGKSSVLDSIMYALAGGKSLPSKPLRNGAKSGKIKIDLGETSHGRLIVERTFTEKGSQLTIKSKEGYEAPSPQAILDDICGKLTFDPLAFSRLKPKEMLATLKELVGVDTAELDNEHATKFVTRTGVNREVQQLKGELAGLPHYEDAPEEVVSVAELAKQLDDASRENNQNATDRRKAQELAKLVDAAKFDAENIRKQIAGLQAELAEQEKHAEAIEKDAAQAATAVETLTDKDLAPIRTQITSAEDTNAKVRANARRSEVEAKLVEAQNRSSDLTNRLAAINEQKESAITAAKFPVSGLGFSEDGITLDGLPFEQASSSQRIKVSAAMGLAMNPELRVMLIRDGSLLGDGAMAMLAEMAEAADAQIWVERVSDGAEVSVVIEDGAVKENRMEALAAAT